MIRIFTKIFLVSLGIFLIGISSKAQTGLDTVIVEKYYISNAADSIVSVGILPVHSVTYRIYVGMKQGYKFQMAYGNSVHPLYINTTTAFFNNEDYGSTTPGFSINNAKKNTVMLDSWLSAGAACNGYFGILKSKDNGVGTVVNSDGILHNNDTAAGIPLTVQDGLIAGSPGSCTLVGIDSNVSVLDATSLIGNSFNISSAIGGAWSCLNGAIGPDTTNQVLIAQVTTTGRMSFKLNIQLGTPSGGIEKFVADNPTGTEIKRNCLTFLSDSAVVNTGVNEVENISLISIFPNPSNGIFTLNINSKNHTPESYYTIYNILGDVLMKKLISKSLYNYNQNIDLSYCPKGIYFIEVSIDGNKTTKKLIRN